MSNVMNTTALQNINPLTVEIPAALALAFETSKDDLKRAEGSTKTVRDAAEKAGFSLAHLSGPNKESTPEHRFNYAMSRRMAGVSVSAVHTTPRKEWPHPLRPSSKWRDRR